MNGTAVETHQPSAASSRFNISKWALDHSALTRYLLVVLLALGIAAYFQLGQDEDPPFTFRVMVIQAFWPGASALEVAEQVTDKIERVAQEVPYSDVIRSYTTPGEFAAWIRAEIVKWAKVVKDSGAKAEGI